MTKGLFQLTIPTTKLEQVQSDLSREFGESNHGINAYDGDVVHAWVEIEGKKVITPSQQAAIENFVCNFEYPYEG